MLKHFMNYTGQCKTKETKNGLIFCINMVFVFHGSESDLDDVAAENFLLNIIFHKLPFSTISIHIQINKRTNFENNVH